MSEAPTPQPEALRNPTASLVDYINNPEVSLTDLLVEAGLSGLSPEQRLELIEQASIEDYTSAVDAIHHKVAPEESHDPHPEPVKITNPRTGEIRSYTAKPEEREGIMAYALSKAQELAKKYREEGGSIDNLLQRCGNVAAFAVVLGHKYKNGNGRAARTVGELIHNGFDKNDPESVSDIETLSANRPESGYRINSYVPSGVWADGEANKRPMDFLDGVAAVNVPFDEESYSKATSGTFTTPRAA